MPHFRNIPHHQSGHSKNDVYSSDILLPSSSDTLPATMEAALSSSSLGNSRLGSIGPDRAHHTKSSARRRDRDDAPYYRETSVTSEDSSDYSPPVPLTRTRTTHSRRKSENHIPRPRNAFIFFRSYYYQNGGKFRVDGDKEKGTHQNDVSRDAGMVWRNLGADERRPFQELAEREKLEHQEKYPNYVYTPGGNKGGSSRRRKSKASTVTKRRKVTASTSIAATREVTEPEPEELVPTSAPFDGATYSLHATAPDYLASTETAFAHSSSPSSSAPDFEYPEPETEDASMYTPVFVPTSDIPHLELSPSDQNQNKVTYDSSSVHPLYHRMNTYLGYNPYVYSGTLSDSSLPPLPQFGQDDIYNMESLLQEPLTPDNLFSSQLSTSFNFEISQASPSYYEQQPVFTDSWPAEIPALPAMDFGHFEQFINMEAFENS